MSFFKYLVSHKKISSDLLIKALVYQQRNSLSLLDCLNENTNLSKEKILSLVVYAEDHQIDLKSAQERSSIIDKAHFDQAFRLFCDRLLPIGKICAEQGFISVADYEALLKDYQSFREAPASSETEAQSLAEETSTEDPEISEAALESLRELGIIDEALFSSEKKK